MAYGTSQARGIIGDPSAQARGRRAFTEQQSRQAEENLAKRREDRQKSQKEKPMQDVPLRKWKDHKNVLKDMAKELKLAKKQWLNMPEGDARNAAIDAWRDGMGAYQETSATLQQQRNVAQQNWENAVEEMQGLEGSDVYGGEVGGMFNKKYSTAAEEYRRLRNGGNIELGEWNIGDPPVFKTRAQKINAADQPVDAEGNVLLDANGKPVQQYELEGFGDFTEGTLDQSPYLLGTSQYKFAGKSYADSAGVTAFNMGDARSKGVLSQSEIQAGIGADGYEALDRGQTEELSGPNFNDAFYEARDQMMGPFNGLDQAGGNPPAGALQNAMNARGYAQGGNTGRKKYDINGNRIA